MRQDVESTTKATSTEIARLQNAAKHVIETRKELADNFTKAREHIEKIFLELHELLNQRQKTLLSESKNIEITSDVILKAQLELLQQHSQVLEGAVNACNMLTHSVNYGLALSVSSTTMEWLNTMLKKVKIVDAPCCSPTVRVFSSAKCGQEIQAFGKFAFGVALSEGKFTTEVTQGADPIACIPFSFTLKVSNVVDTSGTAITPALVVPSLSCFTLTLYFSNGEFTFTNPEWEYNENSGVASTLISFTPKVPGKHSVTIGSHEVGHLDVKAIDLTKTKLVDIPNLCYIGAPLSIQVMPHFSNGEPVSKPSLSVIPKVMQIRSSLQRASTSEEAAPSAVICDGVTQLMVTLNSVGEHTLVVEGCAPPLYTKWVPLLNSPATLFAFSVDISKCLIAALPSCFICNSEMKYQIQLRDSVDKPVDPKNVHYPIEWRVIFDPPQAEGARATVDNDTHTVSWRISQPGKIATLIQGKIGVGSDWRNIKGSPFSATVNRPFKGETARFTTLGATGRDGPGSGAVSQYNGTPLEGLVRINAGIQVSIHPPPS
ncbi:hypothetical protein Pelo_18755 [Pelomyxa schiedti]|nr:hypothetical protein Pelo_18755 [Pelomyxa schiedti]